jgi:hypothetical protein
MIQMNLLASSGFLRKGWLLCYWSLGVMFNRFFSKDLQQKLSRGMAGS